MFVVPAAVFIQLLIAQYRQTHNCIHNSANAITR
jgi:hypothetical protein